MSISIQGERMPKEQTNLSLDRDLKRAVAAECKKYDYPLTSVVEDMLMIWLKYAKNGDNGNSDKKGNGK